MQGDYLIKHWNDITCTKDKIIHLLLSSDVQGLYEQAKQECTKEYGEDITMEAILEYEVYKNNGLFN